MFKKTDQGCVGVGGLHLGPVAGFRVHDLENEIMGKLANLVK